MAAVICDGACKCSECEHHKRDTDRVRNVCFAKPDNFGYAYAKPVNRASGGRNKYPERKDTVPKNTVFFHACFFCLKSALAIARPMS